MTLHEIYYAKKGNYLDIKREGEIFSDIEKYSYQECPVWSHRSNRTFIVKSPLEFNFFVDVQSGTVETDLDDKSLVFIGEDSDLDGKHPIAQIELPRYFFWTESEDIWIEYLDHPLTSLKNNFVSIGGWWNISNYPRGNSFAIQVVDSDRTVSIDKGDPLFRIRFFSKNLDDGFSLIEKEDDYDSILLNQESYKMGERMRENSKELHNKLFKKSCPFSFLHNKDV